MNRSCAPRRERLAEGPFCTVEACDCGTLHVSIGAITLRLAPEVAASIQATLREALRSVERSEDALAMARLFANAQSGRPS